MLPIQLLVNVLILVALITQFTRMQGFITSYIDIAILTLRIQTGLIRQNGAIHPWVVSIILLAIAFGVFAPLFLLNSYGFPQGWQVLNSIFFGNATEAAIMFMVTGIVFAGITGLRMK